MQEQKRIEHEQRRQETMPLDQHAQVRSAVRAVRTIVLDDASDPTDRGKRATDILVELRGPKPAVGTLNDTRGTCPHPVPGRTGRFADHD